jgi:hypothetical protein
VAKVASWRLRRIVGWHRIRGHGHARLRLASSNALNTPRTSAPNRRLLLVISHGSPPDALDREWEGAEQAYPHLRHWVVQIKHAIRERG